MAEEAAPGLEAAALETDTADHDDPPADAQPETAESSDPASAATARAAALAAQFAVEASQQGTVDEEGKRKYDGDGDEPQAKRLVTDAASSDPPAGGADLPAGQVSKVYGCPSDKVGKVIGRAGTTIQELQASTHTRIQIDHSVSGDTKPVTVVGSPDAVEAAIKAIKNVLESDNPTSISAADITKTLDCPQGIVGRIIGRGGETIRSLQTASGAHIAVDQNFPDGVPRKITIAGKADCVQRAASMVEELIRGEPGSASAVVQKFGQGVTRNIDCPKTMVGRVIGKAGDTIKSLQRRFSCSIQIDQNSVPCRITVSGPPNSIGAAEREIMSLIEGGPMPGMGGGGPGGPPFSHGGPGYGGVPPPFGGAPYGGMPYGGYPPAAGYGGYPPMGAYGAAYPGAYPGAPQAQQAYGAAAAPYGGGYGGAAPVDPYAGAYGQQQQHHHAAPAPAPAPAASVWQELHDSEGRSYYYNTQTGVSQWEKPPGM